MKHILPLLLAACYSIAPLFAQMPAIKWQKTIGGNSGEDLRAMQQTADGGYILGRYSLSNISGNKTENLVGGRDYWVVKLDVDGNIQWQNTIGGSSGDFLTSIQQTTDGGYILGGYSYSNISGDKTENSSLIEDYWIVKLDATGNVQWDNTIGGNNSDILRSIQQTNDGGYIIGGYSASDISGDKTENGLGSYDYWVVKLDGSGDILWQETIGGDDADYLSSIQQTADGGYILGGYSFSNISDDKTENNLGNADYWIVKINNAGIIQWQNTIGGTNEDILNQVQLTNDSGYILGGHSSSNVSGDKTENNLGIRDYWVVKLDVTGNIQWQNTIGGDNDDQLAALQQTTDGGYILGGYSASNISGDKTQNTWDGFDYWLVKTDAIGNIEWQSDLGGTDDDQIFCLQQTTDGGYIMGGYSASNISGDKTENSLGNTDYWVIKLSPEVVPTIQPSQNHLEIYPNPATDAIFFKTENTININMYNAFGQLISTQIIQNQDKIDISSLPNGFYFLIESETGVAHKILKNK